MLDARVVVITGASSGLGAEMARQLAARGVSVGLTARRVELLESLAAEIRGRGGTAAVAPADAGDRAQTASAIEELRRDLGPIDLLIANAGAGRGTPGDGFSAADVEAILRVNLLGAVYAIEAVLPEMIERRRGQIAGISSLAAWSGLPQTAAYCASKAGLSTLLESLRVDLAPLGIAVTTVHPGFVRTPMIAGEPGPKPFLMEVEPAARVILEGIARRRREVNFPRPMVALMRCVRRLPRSAFDRLARAAVRSGRIGEPFGKSPAGT